MAGTMVLAPSPVLQFFDNDGKPLVGGLLFTYAGGTTTKQSTFTDETGDTPLPNPIVLNSRGEVAPSSSSASCGLWLDPSLEYKFVLAPATAGDPPTSQFWTIDNVVSPLAAILAALQNFEASLGGVQIGSMVSYGGTTAPPGWLLCFGQAVSRTTYALLFAIIGTAYGVGDGTTTFNLPDKRGRVSVGKDNMGGSTAGRITAAVCGLDGTVLGRAGGDQNAQEDTIVASSSAVTAITDPGHAHTLTVYAVNTFVAPGHPLATNSAAPVDANAPGIAAATTGVTAATAVSTSATSSLTGASQNVQPCEIDNWIIFTGVGG